MAAAASSGPSGAGGSPSVAFVSDPRRDAIDSIRGYVYQIHQSVLACIGLAANDVLMLEGAEDFDLYRIDGAELVQVKDTAANLTLRSGDVRDAIANCWKARRDNPARSIDRLSLSRHRGSRRREKGAPFGKAVPGRRYWREAAEGLCAVQPLPELLLTSAFDDPLLARFVHDADDDAFRSDLLRWIEWDLGASDIDAVLDELHRQVVVPMVDVHATPAQAPAVAQALVSRVADLLTRPGVRKLDRADLLHTMGRAVERPVPIQHYRFLESSGALADPSGRRARAGPASPEHTGVVRAWATAVEAGLWGPRADPYRSPATT